MKVINKETGEIGYLYANKNENYNVLDENDKVLAVYETLEAVVGEWQDYEEPKGIKDIYFTGATVYIEMYNQKEAIEVEKKLKAWKRLRDKGFSIYDWDYEFDMVDKPSQTIILRATAVDSSNTDLDLLFGDEK